MINKALYEALDFPMRWIGVVIAAEERHKLLIVRQKISENGCLVLRLNAKAAASAINNEADSLSIALI